jgi:hypothetical protein
MQSLTPAYPLPTLAGLSMYALRTPALKAGVLLLSPPKAYYNYLSESDLAMAARHVAQGRIIVARQV